MPESVELSAEDCRRLLRAGTVGRVAVSTPIGPHIVPVNYVVSGDAVIFRTSPYSVLGSHARNSLVAFEIDHLDPGKDHSWSVVVRGQCEFIDDPRDLDTADETKRPTAWAAGSRNLFLRLPLTEVTGRSLGGGRAPLVLPV
jgi:nitroimidazol reductase NimA-like FMN-containing flavoprotein (pyridoxamine 5'-phosphate oxidase superfamily)